MMHYILLMWFAFKSVASGCPFDKSDCMQCAQQKYRIVRTGRLPKGIHESSGLALYNQSFVTQEDSGNPPYLFEFDCPLLKNRSPSDTIKLPRSVRNIDWESLAVDKQNNFYIGDFGNNSNQRQDLRIIKFNPETGKQGIIHFKYADQQQYPPRKMKDQNFDGEALLWARDYLYIFSKNRGSSPVKIYRVPDQPGEYVLVPYDSLDIHIQVTGADISSDEQTVALLGYGKVLLYQCAFDADSNLKLIPKYCKQFRRSGQSEGIMFLDDDQLMITNERGKIFYMYKKPDETSSR